MPYPPNGLTMVLTRLALPLAYRQVTTPTGYYGSMQEGNAFRARECS